MAKLRGTPLACFLVLVLCAGGLGTRQNSSLLVSGGTAIKRIFRLQNSQNKKGLIGSRCVPWTSKRVRQSAELRGGGDFFRNPDTPKTSNNVTVEEYVAAVEEKDAKHRTGQSAVTSRCTRSREEELGRTGKTLKSTASDAPGDREGDNNYEQDAAPEQAHSDGDMESSEENRNPGDDPNSIVGVKSHQHKKSNAVGDPDGDDSDDNSEDSSGDWEDFDEESEGIDMDILRDHPSSQLQVEMEVVEDELLDDLEDGEESENAKASGGGGVARLGQRLSRRKTRSNNKQDLRNANPKTSESLENEEIIDAWLPHVYLPPSPDAVSYLVKNARLIDAASKARLDRRTLYAGLLLEWLNQSASNRKFLDPSTSQTLQASLSLASQPEWRRSFPRPNAVRLFENEVGKSCTLGMQETITMALVRFI